MLLNGTPLTASTNFVDTSAPPTQSNAYFVRAGGEWRRAGGERLVHAAGERPHAAVPGDPAADPAGGTTPSGESYTYTANDCRVGDLDGDGEHEYVLKWDPTNAKDNSQSGYTGNVFLDAYELNGTRLWRIDLGRNIRAGAHYTQFLVYDFDGDGTRRGHVQDRRRHAQRHRPGDRQRERRSPQFERLHPRRAGVPDRLQRPDRRRPRHHQLRAGARQRRVDWGDTYGNRVDRFLAGVAYLDGQRPSAIFSRGYYTRAVIAAWDWRNGQLTQRWVFDSNNAGSRITARATTTCRSPTSTTTAARRSSSAPRPSTTTAPPLYTTGLGHGDALHVGDFVPSRAGLEIWDIHESSNQPGADLRDARNGARIFATPNNNGVEGPGRGVAADIWSGNAGAEYWGAGRSMTVPAQRRRAANIGRKPGSANFLAWWDADTVRELVDGNHVDKYGTGGDTRLLTADGATSNNGTKSTPALSGDIFGDWREEVIWRTTDNTALRIYTTTNVATQPHLHAAARSAVPRGDRLAEHGLQPAAASGLLHRRQHGDAADAEHRAGRAARRRIRTGYADLPGREPRRWAAARCRRAPTAASSAAATSTSPRPAASRRSTTWTAAAAAAQRCASALRWARPPAAPAAAGERRRRRTSRSSRPGRGRPGRR